VFAVSASAKALDRPGTARGLRGLGLPRPYPLAVVLTTVEAALAVGLLAVPSVAAPAAAAVLVAFTVFLRQRLAAGTHVPCACFGRWGAAPLSAADLLRNAWLLVLCGLAVFAPRPQRPSALAAVSVAVGVPLAAGSVTVLRRTVARQTSVDRP
jgi:hypothetical protein